jgi:hypothetical protein
VDGSNPDHVKMMIDELQGKYDKIVSVLQSELEDSKMVQEETLSTGLLKLPKAVRNMTVKEFNQQHSCDLLAILRSKDGVVVASKMNSQNPSGNASVASSIATEAAGKKRDYQMSGMETPAPYRRNDQPTTAMRTARRGEGL